MACLELLLAEKDSNVQRPTPKREGSVRMEEAQGSRLKLGYLRVYVVGSDQHVHRR